MPGKIWPGDAPRGAPAKSEVEVWNALRASLPDDWVAWHSLRPRDNDNLVRECDFVVASPEFGLLALEVKGGRVEIRGGDWYQDGRRLERSPLLQAMQAVHALDRQLSRTCGTRPPFGSAVVLPGVEFTDPPRGGDADGVVLGRQDLPYLDQALRHVAARAVPRRTVPSMETWERAVHRLWGEQWVPSLSTRDAAASAERRLLRLNEEQLHLLDLVGDSPRVVVTGAAGTGKTLVARELCLRRLRRGQRVLYVCFTKALAQALRRDFAAEPGAATPVRAANVRQLAMEFAREAGRPLDMTRPNAWEELGLEGAQAAEDLRAEPYDLVVVDEAYDLSEADWLLVEVLSRGRHLWALTDPRQHFWRERTLPESLLCDAARFNLPAQHRNPAAIERFAARYAAETTNAAGASAPAGATAATVDVPEGRVGVSVVGAGSVRDAAAAEVRRWLAAGARPADIAVVTLAGQEKSEIVGCTDLCGEPIADAGSDDAATRVVADTFLRFKGFERPFVVVTELGGVDARSEYETRMYIALTRASAEVSIVCTESEAAQDPRLAPPAAGGSHAT